MITRYFSSFRFMMVPLALGLAGCVNGTSSGRMDVTPATFDQLSGWRQENYGNLAGMVQNECHRMASLPDSTSLGGAQDLPYGTKVKDWRGVCAAAPSVVGKAGGTVRQFFEDWFQPYLVAKPAFYTGYYDPEVSASLRQEGAYQVPVYRRPRDLLRGRGAAGDVTFGRWVNSVFRPYDDRATIDAGSLSGKGLEIAWLKSPVDLLFLQMQGSGRLRLQNGRELFIGYDGRNGQPYVPIGRVLIQRGLMRAQDVNAQTVHAWLDSHPDQVQSVLDANPSYVFFRFVERKASEGPKGAFGLPLTPLRSLAVDRHLVSYGMPVWMEMTSHNSQGQPEPWTHLVFAQDTGSDIRGAGRGDLFLGWGSTAQRAAGRLKNQGRMFVLIPRPPAYATPDSSSDGSSAATASSTMRGFGVGAEQR